MVISGLQPPLDNETPRLPSMSFSAEDFVFETGAFCLGGGTNCVFSRDGSDISSVFRSKTVNSETGL